MKNICYVLLCCFILSNCQKPVPQQSHVITEDIEHFWEAYDSIRSTTDSALQVRYLQNLFLDRGTAGLAAMREVRRYSPQSYLQAIQQYPRFWDAIRQNTQKAQSLSKDLEAGVEKFKKLYPDLKPAKIYFTIGALMSNGTTLDSLVLIGSELALADSTIPTEEFPQLLGHLRPFFDSNPIEHIVFLNVHEYVHTQQKNVVGSNLLTQCFNEGIAEFVAEKSMESPSVTPAIAFGKKNDEAVKLAFTKEMFGHNYYNWLWNNTNNPFQMRDLGYYVGYAIADKYFQKTSNKVQAIKTLIELDSPNIESLENFIDETGYFSKSIATLKNEYEGNRPKVIKVSPFANGSQKVRPGVHEVIIQFSTKMDTRFRGFEFGPLGQQHVLAVNEFIGFSEDGTQVKFKVDLKANHRHQLVLSNRFRAESGAELAPYLIEIKTSK